MKACELQQEAFKRTFGGRKRGKFPEMLTWHIGRRIRYRQAMQVYRNNLMYLKIVEEILAHGAKKNTERFQDI